MSDKTGISYANSAWNIVEGCTPKSAGCRECWAKALHDMRHKAYLAEKKMPPQYAQPFSTIQLLRQRLEQPLHWKRPRRIFTASTGDLFHTQVPFEFIDAAFDVMRRADWHTFLVLTKRPEWALEWFGMHEQPFDLPENVWFGVSVENQKMANERIPLLQALPAAVRFLSVEPLIGPVDLVGAMTPGDSQWDEVNAEDNDDSEPEQFIEECEAECDWVNYGNDLVINPEWREWNIIRKRRAKAKTFRDQIDWVVVGGESGTNARPMSPEWARSIRDVCKKLDVTFYFKQWGEFAPMSACLAAGMTTFKHKPVNVDGEMMVRIGKGLAGHLLDGEEWRQVPTTNPLPGLPPNADGTHLGEGEEKEGEKS
jgi:protein gp37